MGDGNAAVAARNVTLRRPTRAVGGSKHPRLQILTVEALLSGQRIDMPAQQEIRSFKQAPKAKAKKTEEARLF